jgi:hypothetical protein
MHAYGGIESADQKSIHLGLTDFLAGRLAGRLADCYLRETRKGADVRFKNFGFAVAGAETGLVAGDGGSIAV